MHAVLFLHVGVRSLEGQSTLVCPWFMMGDIHRTLCRISAQFSVHHSPYFGSDIVVTGALLNWAKYSAIAGSVSNIIDQQQMVVKFQSDMVKDLVVNAKAEWL
jgi:hypothetical protein